MPKFENHRFFCTQCGKEGLSVWRNSATQRGKGHLKKLYCIYCKAEKNHYECYNEKDIVKFRMKFERGDFENDNT